MTTAALMELTGSCATAGLRDQVAVVEATVDPWRDNAARLRAYQRLSGADFTMLTGSQAAIHRLWSFFGVYYRRVPQGHPPDVDWMTGKPETFDVQHTDAVFILDPAGQELIADEGMPQVDGALPVKLRSLLNAQGRQNLAHPQLAWTANELIEDVYYAMNRNVPARALAKVTPPSRAAAAADLAGSPHPLAALHLEAGRCSARPRRCRPSYTRCGVTRSCSISGPRGVRRAGRNSRCSPRPRPVTAARWRSSATTRATMPVDARTFLSTHPVSYPSFEASVATLSSLAQLQGLPMTVFLNRSGRVVNVHIGAYETQTTLTQDIERYALGE